MCAYRYYFQEKVNCQRLRHSVSSLICREQKRSHYSNFQLAARLKKSSYLNGNQNDFFLCRKYHKTTKDICYKANCTGGNNICALSPYRDPN